MMLEIIEMQGYFLTHPSLTQLAAYKMARDTTKPTFESIKTPINTSVEFKHVIELEKRTLEKNIDKEVDSRTNQMRDKLMEEIEQKNESKISYLQHNLNHKENLLQESNHLVAKLKKDIEFLNQNIMNYEKQK